MVKEIQKILSGWTPRSDGSRSDAKAMGVGLVLERGRVQVKPGVSFEVTENGPRLVVKSGDEVLQVPLHRERGGFRDLFRR